MTEQVVSWKPLGVLLVDRGLLTVEQLDDALKEQSRTGEQLGSILVARKVVAGAVLTAILAEQIGVELEIQGGYGSGLFSKMARRNGPSNAAFHERSPAMPLEAADGPAKAHPEQDDLEFQLSALRAEVEALRARNDALEAELSALSAKKKAPSRRKPAKSVG